MSVYNMELAQNWGQQLPPQQPHLQLEEEYSYLLSNQDRSQNPHRLSTQNARTAQTFSSSLSTSQHPHYSPYSPDPFSSPSPNGAQQQSFHNGPSGLSSNETGVVNNHINSMGAGDHPHNGFATNQSQLTTPQNSFRSTQFSYRSGYRLNSSNPSDSPNGGSSLNDNGGTPTFSALGPMQFPYPHPPPRRQSDMQQGYNFPQGPLPREATSAMRPLKRPRLPDETDGGALNDDTDAYTEPNNEGLPRKTMGACGRCKGLKVRCEFKTEHDPCKRCLSAGQECIIPGRKKRRTPPKREHLINQIRDQADEIQRLMAQLESITRSQNAAASVVTDASPTTPGYSESANTPASTTDLQSPDVDPISSSSEVVPKPEVQDWFAKAQESIVAFGSYIGTAGTADISRTDTTASDDEDEYEVIVENSDKENIGNVTEEDSHSSHSATRDDLPLSSPNTKKKELDGALPIEAPFGLIAKLSLRNRASVEPQSPEDAVGVANVDFFKSSQGRGPIRSNPAIKTQQLPHILARGIVSPEAAEKLFHTYFDKMNISTSLLDPILYTPQYTVMRSPFLFTAICAVASRYDTGRPELHNLIMRYAQLAAGTALISGPKNEELCAGYILLQLYPVHSRRWEEDRSWIYLGLAIRIAQDLNLNRPNRTKPLNERHARVLLNRTRIWLNCFNLDRSTGSQFGRMPIIKNTDYAANHSEDWWQSEYTLPNFDIHLCCYSAELRCIADFMSHIFSDHTQPTGMNKNVDIEQLASETEDKLLSLQKVWFERLDQTDQTNIENRFRTGLLRLAFSYGRLVVLSYGFQHSFGGSRTGENPFFKRCLRAAKDVVKVVLDDIARPEQRVYVRHGPDAQSIFVTFACAFLVKLLQPKYIMYLTIEERLEIRSQVQRGVDMLGSLEVAVDERHAPKLYSRFLQGLLATPMARVDSSDSLLRRRSRRQPKSSEAGSEFSYSNYGSPSATSQSSPSPIHADMQYNQFAPPMDGHQQPSTSDMPLLFDQSQNPGSFMSTNEFFVPPMPFDSELLESMQTMPNPVWQDTTVPGFNWMSQMQSGSDVNMSYTDYTMYEQQYGSARYHG